MSRAGVVLALAALFAGVAPAAGFGQGVDPDSPAGVEYALPHEEARRQADPNGRGGSSPPTAPAGTPQGSAAGARSSGAPALFGSGISKKAGAARERERGSDEQGGGSSGPGPFAPVESTPAQARQVGDSGSSLGWSLGAALAVLLLGAGVALAVRRRPSRN